MKIGLLSDTHGNRERTAAAIRVLRAARVGAVLHAGDIGDPAILAELGAAFGLQGVPVHAVAGNVDGWDAEILRFPSSGGVTVHPASAELELGGRRIFLTHGHLGPALERAIAGGVFGLVVHGHTHVPRDERIGPTRVVNPGAVHRSPDPSVAVLDTQTDELAFLSLG